MINLLYRLEDSNDFALAEFGGDADIPPYAILSHTWATSEEEVIFSDIRNGTGKYKPGFEKLLFCSEQAKKDGFIYFWIDSCCIATPRSGDQVPMLASIFSYFQRATKCYVYLSDVSASDAISTSHASQKRWIEQFRSCRWFTRGWTLQELIAPPSVEFFSREGRHLGTKISLEQEIHQITSIPIAVLRGGSVDEYSFEERMTWIAGRFTRPPEDRIRCLCGISGISLDGSYGRGEENLARQLKDKILQRQEELRESADHDDGLSIQSIESSTTLVSILSDLIAVDASATVELERIFQEDAKLVDLYHLALKDVPTDPDRLQRNTARLLQFFARDLRHEASNDIEKLASRFVRSKAQYLAKYIIETFHNTPRVPQQPIVYIEKQIGEQDEEIQNESQFEDMRTATGIHEMDEMVPIDENDFEDLPKLRMFLIRSSAFQIFQARLDKFVRRSEYLHQLDIDSIAKGRSIKSLLSTLRTCLGSTSQMIKSILIAAGCLEPPLQPGFIRLRWQCVSSQTNLISTQHLETTLGNTLTK